MTLCTIPQPSGTSGSPFPGSGLCSGSDKERRSSEGHRLRRRLRAEPGEPGRGFPSEGKGGGGGEAAGSSSQALRARTPRECLTREGKAAVPARTCSPEPAAPRMGEMAAVRAGGSWGAPARALGFGKRSRLASASCGKMGGRSKSPRHQGRGGRAALHFQHSCSVLQRLVLAPLLLPYCFQKH